MYPILFKFGPITVYTYGAFVAAGMAVGLYLSSRKAKHEQVNPDEIISLLLWAVLAGFAGARLFYVIVEWKYFLENPLKIILANEGFVFYGAFIFAFLTGIFYAARKKLPIWKTADIIAPSIAIAEAIGRLGCFFYGCCYGRPTKSFIGVLFPPDSPAGQLGVKVIPTQLIWSFVLFLIFLGLTIKRKYKTFEGEIFWLYVLLYAVTRFLMEFLRGDPRGSIWIFSTSQFIAVIMVIIAVVMRVKLGHCSRK